ncbi:MAG: Stk1 family PASTA domain-containing Ser/Thr kinase [bacterium]
MSHAKGTVIAGRYEILELIAEGGMSTVYRARRQADGAIVALKILRDQYAADREFLERFAREAHAAETLTHPNIVRVHETGQDGTTYFLAMEYVDGIDLKVHLRRIGRLEAGDAERIARAVCDALDYAHRQGIVHRDIKPQNILMASDGTVKVADFGIARAMAAVTITQTGTVLGSVQYMSPEQARGAGVGRASDVYALGVVLFEMLTGRVPFEGESPIAIALKHLHDAPPRAREIEPSVPRRLEGIILKATAKRSEDRYTSARDMATDLAGETDQWTELLDTEETTRMFEFDEDEEQAGGGTMRSRIRSYSTRIAVVLLGAVMLGLWTGWQAVSAYLNVPEVEIPKVVGRTLPQATEIARQAGLALEVVERAYSSSVPQDVVISQDQPAGKRVKQGRRLGVAVSLGTQLVAVPDLVQQTLQQAQLALDTARLKTGRLQEAYDDVVRPGAVLRQDPAAGSRVPIDSPVTLVISRGPTQIDMPALVGRRLEAARRLLDERSLTITYLRTVASTDVEPGTVIEQTPAAGAKIRPGHVTITLTVSARPGEESAPPQAPVITAEPQAVETPRAAPTPRAPGPRATPGPQASPGPRATPGPPSVLRRTRIQVVVPEGPASQEVRIVVIDELGVRTLYRSAHAPGERVDQVVQSKGFTVIQVYIDNRLVQEVRP